MKIVVLYKKKSNPIKWFNSWYEAADWTDKFIKKDTDLYYFNSASGIRSIFVKIIIFIKNYTK